METTTRNQPSDQRHQPHSRVVKILSATLAATGIGGCGQLERPDADATRGPAATGQFATAGSDPDRPRSGARQLVAELAVLRRRQTANDQPPATVARTLSPRIVPGLTRLVATGHTETLGEFRIYLIVGAAAPCPAGTWPSTVPPGGDRVSLITVSSKPPYQASFSMGFSARDLQRFAVSPTGLGQYWRGGTQVLSSVIPDGVTRARWLFAWVPHAGTAKHPPYVVVHPAVRDNVAVARIGQWETQARATLYPASGRVLTSQDEAANLPLCHRRTDAGY